MFLFDTLRTSVMVLVKLWMFMMILIRFDIYWKNSFWYQKTFENFENTHFEYSIIYLIKKPSGRFDCHPIDILNKKGIFCFVGGKKLCRYLGNCAKAKDLTAALLWLQGVKDAIFWQQLFLCYYPMTIFERHWTSRLSDAFWMSLSHFFRYQTEL